MVSKYCLTDSTGALGSVSIGGGEGRAGAADVDRSAIQLLVWGHPQHCLLKLRGRVDLHVLVHVEGGQLGPGGWSGGPVELQLSLMFC
eukprot:470983-Rhodomonas_salina.1